MGFYDEDDIFSNIPEYNRSPQQPQSKRLRLNEPSTSWTAEFPRSAFDETLDKPDTVDAADEDDERDSEDVEVRLAALRRIGMRANPRRALRRYLLNKVATGEESNPWLSTVCSEKSLRKKLRRYILGMMVRACEEEGVEDCQVEQSHTDAFKFIDRLNEELVQSIAAVGTFSTEQLRCARSNCQKAFLPRRVASTLVMRVRGDYSHCQLLCFCTFHNGLFEFMFDFIHMKWNIYHNCLVHVGKILAHRKFKDSDEVIDELPSDVLRSLVHYYMARYFCFWVFGDPTLWTKNGCTLFQAISGS